MHPGHHAIHPGHHASPSGAQAEDVKNTKLDSFRSHSIKPHSSGGTAAAPVLLEDMMHVTDDAGQELVLIHGTDASGKECLWPIPDLGIASAVKSVAKTVVKAVNKGVTFSAEGKIVNAINEASDSIPDKIVDKFQFSSPSVPQDIGERKRILERTALKGAGLALADFVTMMGDPMRVQSFDNADAILTLATKVADNLRAKSGLLSSNVEKKKKAQDKIDAKNKVKADTAAAAAAVTGPVPAPTDQPAGTGLLESSTDETSTGWLSDKIEQAVTKDASDAAVKSDALIAKEKEGAKKVLKMAAKKTAALAIFFIFENITLASGEVPAKNLVFANKLDTMKTEQNLEWSKMLRVAKLNKGERAFIPAAAAGPPVNVLSDPAAAEPAAQQLDEESESEVPRSQVLPAAEAAARKAGRHFRREYKN